jgi:hypothetical protein
VKRREHGINLDDGVALSDRKEFGLLYVPCRAEEMARIEAWIQEDDVTPLVVAGQIGSGKTTLLNALLRNYAPHQIIRLRVDEDPLEPTEGGFCGVLLGQILSTCLKSSISPEGCGLVVSDFADLGVDSWPALQTRLTTRPDSLSQAASTRGIYRTLEDNAQLVRRACDELLSRVREETGRAPPVIAEGIDKFDPYGADFFSLKNTLRFLAARKTLFEVNAVHLFGFPEFGTEQHTVFVGSMGDDELRRVLQKRMGEYAPVFDNAYPILAHYSGGNVRQALRMLSAFYSLRAKQRKEHDAAVAMACHRVAHDLLSVFAGRFSNEFMTAVKRDGYAEGSLFSDQKTRDGAMHAIYRNWVFLLQEPQCDTPTRWPAAINPLIHNAIAWPEVEAPSAEEIAVRRWALQHNVSPIGLGCQTSVETGMPDWRSFQEQYDSSVLSEEDAISAIRLLEEIGGGLFGEERQDRIVVTYQAEEHLETVRDFLVGKANAYGFFPCVEIDLLGGEGYEPIPQLLISLSRPDSHVIYSVHIRGDWTDSQLRDLERIRDVFGNLQMLWWMQRDALVSYLPQWPQLRQYFRFYELETELWRGLSQDEIEADLEFIREMSEEDDPEGARRLQTVLEYLHSTRGQP